MGKVCFFYLGILFLLVSCDSFPKKMHAEKAASLIKEDNIKISAECSERANQFPFPKFKNFITLELYIVNSSLLPIEFIPAELVTPETSNIEFDWAAGGREASKKAVLSQKKTIAVGAGEDYLIDVHFGFKSEHQLSKTVFKLSGILIDKQVRPAETVFCQPIRVP